MTENNKSAYELSDIKSAFDAPGKLRMTFSAQQGQLSLNFNDMDVVKAIQALTDNDFYKSMSPKRPGFTAWQDVYKSTFKGVELYIKFQVNHKKELILSFKEK